MVLDTRAIKAMLPTRRDVCAAVVTTLMPKTKLLPPRRNRPEATTPTGGYSAPVPHLVIRATTPTLAHGGALLTSLKTVVSKLDDIATFVMPPPI